MSKKTIETLKKLAIAHDVASEYDYVPEPSELNDAKELFPEVTKDILGQYQGLRADEIINKILKHVGEL